MPSVDDIAKEKAHLKHVEHKIAEPTCCMCVPYRLGVFINALATVLMSCAVLFLKNFENFETFIRQIYGGYGLYSKICVGALEVSGLVWGIIGMSGAIRNSATQVGIFLMYQYIRVTLWLVVYCLDFPELWSCETWVNNIDAKLKEGWNPTMYTVALNGRCFQERIFYGVFSLTALCLFVYLTWVNQKFVNKLQHQLTYKLDTKNESVRQWYTRSATEFHGNAENMQDWSRMGGDAEINAGTYFMLGGEGSSHRQQWDEEIAQGRNPMHRENAPARQPGRGRPLPTSTGFLGKNFEPAAQPTVAAFEVPAVGENTPLMNAGPPPAGMFPGPRAPQGAPPPGHIPPGMMHGAQARF